MKSHTIYTAFLVCIGIVVGTLVSNITKSIQWLSWLSFGINFGLQEPVIINLGVLQLTFGITVDLTISVIIFVVTSLLLGKALVKN